jgi:hypothetical protein
VKTKKTHVDFTSLLQNARLHIWTREQIVAFEANYVWWVREGIILAI